ncbi:MAG: PEP-CTERM sorting domain-containing protein, partial [Verrucomicrobiaceae bacterium]
PAALRMGRTGAAIVNRGIVGTLSQSITLANPGDTLTLSFKFRFTTTAGSTEPYNADGGFTFGFYNSNNTAVIENDSTASDNDFGFRGEFGSGTTGRVAIFKETNVSTSGGGLGTGTDGGAVTVNNGVNVAVGDFLPHTASLTLTYNSPTDMGISLTYDGNAVGSGTSTVPFFTFDEVVFSQGGGNGFLLDDVVVSSTVPEPGSVAFVALGGVLCAAGCRRRK